MSKKKIWELIGLVIIMLGLGVSFGAIIASHHRPAVEKQSNKVNKQSSATSKKHHKKSVAKASSSSSAKTANEQFDNLPQKTQIALLINHQAVIHDMKPYTNTHYSIYMGVPNKIVIFDDGEGAGGTIVHSTLITDNQDGSFTYASVKTTGSSNAMADASNSWWEDYATTQKATLLEEYSSSKATVDEVASEVDLSKSSETFDYVPVNQTTNPATADDYDSNDDTDYDDSDDADQPDDDYYAKKAREPNADYYLPDGTHIHNDDQGNSYNVDTGEEIGKGGSAGN